MDRATKVSVEKYPHGTFDGEIGDSLRAACAVGYMQAEKDLALTWQDIAQILTIYEQCVDDGIISRYGDYHSVEGASVEVLRRFIEMKEDNSH